MRDIALALRIQTEYLRYGLQPPPLESAQWDTGDVLGQFEHACKRKFRKVFKLAYRAEVTKIKQGLTRAGWLAMGHKRTRTRDHRERVVDRQLLELDMQLALDPGGYGTPTWKMRMACRRRLVHRYLVGCARSQEDGV